MLSLRLVRLAASLLALAALLVPRPALANGRPIQIVLTYLPNVSNTGSPSASGIAELVLAAGEVRASATGLVRLDPPGRYQAWVVNTNTNESLPVGQFNTAYTTGNATLDQVLPDPIPDKGWNLFLITLEDTPNPTSPSERRSIAGYFPSPEAQPEPSQLPNTGGPVPVELVTLQTQEERTRFAGLAALVLVLGLTAGYVLGRRRSAPPPASHRKS